MTGPARIDPDALYDGTAVRLTLPIGPETLARARRNGSLRYTRQGGRILYLGRWLIDWLVSSSAPASATSDSREMIPA